VDASGNGNLCFHGKGGIIAALGEGGGLATTWIVSLSRDLAKIRALTKINEPYPRLFLSRNEKYLMACSDTIHLWDMNAGKLAWHLGGKLEPAVTAFHPVKRAIFTALGNRVQCIVERPAVTLDLSGKWRATGRFAYHFDSFYLAGKGKIGTGYGAWLREDWTTDEVFYNATYSIRLPLNDDLNEEGELSFRTKNPGRFTLYGGRTAKEGKDVRTLLENIPAW
jgi:hypothetical protein